MHCVGTQSPSHHPVHPVPNVLGREPPGLGDPVHSHSHPVTPAQYFRDWVGHEVECALHSAKWSAHTGTVHPVLGTNLGQLHFKKVGQMWNNWIIQQY